MASPTAGTAGLADRFAARGFAFAPIAAETVLRVEAAFSAARHFFEAPAAEKLADAMPLDAGYRPQEVEYSDAHDHPDEVESFTLFGRREGVSARLM